MSSSGCRAPHDIKPGTCYSDHSTLNKTSPALNEQLSLHSAADRSRTGTSRTAALSKGLMVQQVAAHGEELPRVHLPPTSPWCRENNVCSVSDNYS